MRTGSEDRREGPERALTLVDAAREYIWLYDQRHGLSVQQIANREGVSVHQVKRGLRRARALDARHGRVGPGGAGGLGAGLEPAPQLVPLFPVGSLVPSSECPHRGPIEAGSNLCCMVCHQSGLDGHPGLQRDPKTDPPPEPKSGPATVPMPARWSGAGATRQTRKERRKRRFAS